jgi:hypothetical protein
MSSLEKTHNNTVPFRRKLPPNGVYRQARWDLRYRHFRCVDGWEGIER